MSNQLWVEWMYGEKRAYQPEGAQEKKSESKPPKKDRKPPKKPSRDEDDD